MMTPETVINLGQNALQVTLLIISILLLPALAVGLLVSMFQAATQINEQTLSFIPKLFVIFIVLLIAGQWILSLMTNFMSTLISNIPSMLG